MLKKMFFVLSVVVSFVAGISPASAGELVELPIQWRLQSYNSGEVVVFYSASPCSSGALRLVPSDSDALKDRFISLVLTAKMARKRVGVFYDEANSCRITSFYLKEGGVIEARL